MTVFDATGINVLIVDDNLHFRTLMRTILRTVGFENVEEARDGAEGFEVLSSFEADIAIIDWKMDGLDGLEFVRRIRADEDSPNKYLPIIMVTGYTEESLAKAARDAGVNDFLGKPISAKSLMSRIVSVFADEREFIEETNYFGPDRRRGKKEFKGEERRKPALK